MVKYFFKRFFRGCISVIIAVALIMLMVFSWLDPTLIFAEDEQYVKLANNQKLIYTYQKWEEYDYLDYVPYTDWLNAKVAAGEITEAERASVATIGRTAADDSAKTAQYVAEFTAEYEAQGYTVARLDAVMATPPALRRAARSRSSPTRIRRSSYAWRISSSAYSTLTTSTTSRRT